MLNEKVNVKVKDKVVTKCFASVISEIQQSDIYLTVKARLFETPGANLNGVRVTSAFLDDIIQNEEKYVGLPLYADVKALAEGNYAHLGHLYNSRTGEFRSTQIGSFFKFEKEDFDNGGAALIGYARIAKRNKAVCKALSEMFTDGALKFSFEISCSAYAELEDGTIEIDTAEGNFLEGFAVVSFPACENAVALELVAECNEINGGKDEPFMTDVKEDVLVIDAAYVNISDSEVKTPAQETVEEVIAETENTETEEKTEEVVAEEEQQEERPEEEVNEVVAEEEKEEEVIAEAESEAVEEPAEHVTQEEALASIFSKLQSAIEMLSEKIDSLSALRELAEHKNEAADIDAAEAVDEIIAEANPLTDDMTIKQYTLLDSDPGFTGAYTLV